MKQKYYAIANGFGVDAVKLGTAVGKQHLTVPLRDGAVASVVALPHSAPRAGLIVSTWRECEMLVKGFSGAIYKSFESLAEASQFLVSTKPRVFEPKSKSASIPSITPTPDKKSGNLSKNDLIQERTTCSSFFRSVSKGSIIPIGLSQNFSAKPPAVTKISTSLAIVPSCFISYSPLNYDLTDGRSLARRGDHKHANSLLPKTSPQTAGYFVQTRRGTEKGGAVKVTFDMVGQGASCGSHVDGRELMQRVVDEVAALCCLLNQKGQTSTSMSEGVGGGVATARFPHPLVVYTDGACTNNGSQRHARGGYGCYFGPKDPRNLSVPLSDHLPPDTASPLALSSEEQEIYKVTNNVAELRAIISSIRVAVQEHENSLKNNHISHPVLCPPLYICTDSSYCIDGITSYIFNWVKRGFMRSLGGTTEPVLNKPLWIELLNLVNTRRQQFRDALRTFYKQVSTVAETRVVETAAPTIASLMKSEMEWNFNLFAFRAAVVFFLVKGHTGVIEGNEAADALAVEAAQMDKTAERLQQLRKRARD